MQNEFWRSWQRIDLVNRGFQCGDHIGIRGLIESHVAIADLREAQLPDSIQFLRVIVGTERVRLQHTSLDQA